MSWFSELSYAKFPSTSNIVQSALCCLIMRYNNIRMSEIIMTDSVIEYNESAGLSLGFIRGCLECNYLGTESAGNMTQYGQINVLR